MSKRHGARPEKGFRSFPQYGVFTPVPAVLGFAVMVPSDLFGYATAGAPSHKFNVQRKTLGVKGTANSGATGKPDAWTVAARKERQADWFRRWPGGVRQAGRQRHKRVR